MPISQRIANPIAGPTSMFIAQSFFAYGSSSSLLDGSESDGTNLLTGGAGMTADWFVSFATLTNAAAVAPDGTTTASSLIESASDNRHIAYYEHTAANIGTFSSSVYVKTAGRRYVVLYMTDTGGNVASAYVDLNTGTITDTETVGTATIGSTSIESGSNGYYKVTINGNYGAGETNPRYMIIALSNVGVYGAPLTNDNPQYTGDGTSGVYVWRPKLVDV